MKIKTIRWLLSFKESKSIKIKHEEKELWIDHIIKYFHSYVRFWISKKVEHEFNVKQKPVRFKKFNINSKILKIYCEIIRNITLNKIWNKLNKIYKKVIETSCFFQIMNKIKFKKIDWVDFVNFNIEVERLDYHYTNNFESRIEETHVWFIIDMKNKKQKNAIIMNVVRRHINWKIQKHINYKKTCKKYILNKKRWEYQLIKKMNDIHNIDWSIERFMSEVLVLTNSRHDKKLKDYKSILKKKIVKIKKKSQNNDTTNAENEKK